MKNSKKQLIIVGGGIMGLMTAYYASQLIKNILIIDKSTIGNSKAASFSFTRSIRNDYLDPDYSRLAYESREQWLLMQKKVKKKFLFSSGCLNLAKKSVTPSIKNSYAQMAYENEKNINLQVKRFTQKELEKNYPQFCADIGCLDIQAGFLYLPVITEFLLRTLKQRGVTLVENASIDNIKEKRCISIETSQGTYQTNSLVITSALGTNEVLRKIQNNFLQLPLFPDKPKECKYIYIQKKLQSSFSPKNFPVFAYLDVGIYGHPIFNKEKSCIKIGYYNPLDVRKKINKKIKSIDDFINECLPILRDSKREYVQDADQCSYDMVEDDNFILGRLPGYKNIVIGCGWRGTGYKFAPLIGKILMQLSIQKGTVYNIERFSPERFVK